MAQGFDACRLRRGAAVWFALAAWAAIGLAAPVARADESEKAGVNFARRCSAASPSAMAARC